MVAFFFCHPSDEEIDFEQYSSGYSSAEVSERLLFHISGELWSITVVSRCTRKRIDHSCFD